MAEIYGITLKGCKEFQGMEGNGVQGNIYMDGKKIGWYNDRADGGEVEIDYSSDEIEREVTTRMEGFFKRHPYEYPKPDFFYFTVLQLKDYEKHLKKAVKRGCNSILAQDALKSDFPNDCTRLIYFDSNSMTVESIVKEYHLEKYAHLRVYSVPEDFCIKMGD